MIPKYEGGGKHNSLCFGQTREGWTIRNWIREFIIEKQSPWQVSYYVNIYQPNHDWVRLLN